MKLLASFDQLARWPGRLQSCRGHLASFYIAIIPATLVPVSAMFSAQSATTNRSAAVAVNMTQKTRWIVAAIFPLVVGPLWCLAWHGHGGRFGTLSGLVLVAALATSAVTDFNRQRIYNWTTYTAFLWAVAISIFATLSASSGESLGLTFETAPIIGLHWLGGIGIGECLAGAAACFFILFFGYDLSGGGAGDVKLATVIGALLGLHDGIFAVGYSYIIAAAVIIAWSTWKNGPLTLIRAGLRAVGKFLGPLWPFHTTAEDRKLLLTPVPLGPYFLIGTLLVFFGLVPT
jgi:Flp pilus assembly protein protease CpaA